mmetsp:Transcript_46270/g.82665  ORF Transcript_46270/g.82665 Transcript_46270/m.82665 type:complete len:107 (-) Transcript_46270:424-744(-)
MYCRMTGNTNTDFYNSFGIGIGIESSKTGAISLVLLIDLHAAGFFHCTAKKPLDYCVWTSLSTATMRAFIAFCHHQDASPLRVHTLCGTQSGMGGRKLASPADPGS